MLSQRRLAGPLLVLDGGGSLAPLPRIARSVPGKEMQNPAITDIEQRRVKADLIASATALGGIDAMALSAGDWALGTGFVRELAGRYKLPVLAANLVCGGEHPFPGAIVLAQSGRKIGVVGITLGVVEGCEVTDPVVAIHDAVAALGTVDVVVGLFPYDSDRGAAELWNNKLPVQIAIDARGRSIGGLPDNHVDSWWLSGGSRGKSVGLMDLSFTPGAAGWVAAGAEDGLRKQLETAEARLREVETKLGDPTNQSNEAALQRLNKQREAYQTSVERQRTQLAALSNTNTSHRFTLASVDLGTDVIDHSQTAALVVAAKERITKLVPFDPKTFVPRVVTTESSPFAGGEACANCHAPEHAQWSTTGHARAWSSLTASNRAMDSDCWTCHVTGANAAGGPAQPTDAGGLRDVQCEACHGPGRAHVLAPTDKGKVLREPEASTCTQCHDGDRDGGRFDLSLYRPKVVHTGAVAP